MKTGIVRIGYAPITFGTGTVTFGTPVYLKILCGLWRKQRIILFLMNKHGLTALRIFPL